MSVLLRRTRFNKHWQIKSQNLQFNNHNANQWMRLKYNLSLQTKQIKTEETKNENQSKNCDFAQNDITDKNTEMTLLYAHRYNKALKAVKRLSITTMIGSVVFILAFLFFTKFLNYKNTHTLTK